MHNRRGMTMRRYVIMLVALLAIGAQANAQSVGAPYIAVKGQAQRDVVPDTFPVRINISETSMDGAATQARIEALAARVIDLVESGSNGDALIKVANLSISPMHRYDRDSERQVFIGNAYQRSISVEYKSLERLRDLIAALPEDKALDIDTGAFSTSHEDEIRQELTIEAIANARATASALAQGVGRRLGPVHTISTEGFDLNYSSGGVAHALAAPAPPAAAVMREGNITIHQNVYIVYTLAD